MEINILDLQGAAMEYLTSSLVSMHPIDSADSTSLSEFISSIVGEDVSNLACWFLNGMYEGEPELARDITTIYEEYKHNADRLVEHLNNLDQDQDQDYETSSLADLASEVTDNVSDFFLKATP
jgi:hypothetical protein